MKVGIIGLGRMGAAIAKRLLKSEIQVFGYDPSESLKLDIQNNLFERVSNLETLMKNVDVVWLLVPAGKIVDDVIDSILPHLNSEQIVVDAGNSFFKDSIRRYEKLKNYGISFLDCGTSGGLYGEQHGFSLMIGGDQAAYNKCKKIFDSIAWPSDGEINRLIGPPGSGHYVKMIHNGIEYALMQSYAEGFNFIKNSCFFKDLNLEQISRIWNEGSIIRSWLLKLLQEIFEKDQDFKNISGEVEEMGTGKWTVQTAKECDIKVDLIEKAVEERLKSRKSGGNFMTKILALLRNAFGGHRVKNTN